MAKKKKPTMAQVKKKMIRVLEGRSPSATTKENAIFYDLLVDGVKRPRKDHDAPSLWPANPDLTDVSHNVQDLAFKAPFEIHKFKVYYAP